MNDSSWRSATTRRLDRRRLLRGATGGGALAAAFLAACSGDENESSSSAGTRDTSTAGTTTGDDGQPAAGGTWRFSGGATLDIWDPQWNASSYTLSPMLALVFNKLLKWGEITKGEIQPDLAASYEQVDSRTLVYRLRPNVVWHDKPPTNGRAFTADDVKFSFERQLNPNEPRFQRRYQWEAIDKIETPDQQTVRITLKEPTAPFLANTAGQWAFMVPRDAVEELGDLNKPQGMIGTGPFMYEDWRADEHYLMKRNPKYFLANQPYLEASESLPFADTAAAEAAFRTKKIDHNYLGSWPYPIVDKLRKDIPELNYEARGNLYFWYVRFNVKRAPFDDVRVRKAISYAIDRQQAIDSVLFGYGKPNGPIPWTLSNWALPPDELAKYPGYPSPDNAALAEAKKLLEAAGYSESKPLKFDGPTVGPGAIQSTSETFRENLKRVGIEYDIAVTQFPQLLKSQTAKEMAIWFAQDNGYEDPDEFLSSAFRTGASRNFFDYSNPEVDALLDKQRQTPDPAARKAIVLDVQRKLMEDLPNVFVISSQAHFLWWPYIKNRRNSEWLNLYQIEDVWIDKSDPAYKGRPS